MIVPYKIYFKIIFRKLFNLDVLIVDFFIYIKCLEITNLHCVPVFPMACELEKDEEKCTSILAEKVICFKLIVIVHVSSELICILIGGCARRSFR